MSKILTKINAHLDNVSFYQTIFSMPFAYVAAILADPGTIHWDIMFWITVVVIAARSAAMGLDNYFDYKYDKQQPRLSYRAMVQGRVKGPEVLVFVAVCLVIMVLAVLQLNPLCLKLLPVAALPFIIYPFTKRFTFLCHYCCGIAVAMAPLGGWVAVAGEVSYPMFVLYTAVALWIAGFDCAYAAQDEEFDKAHKLHSMATKLGKVRAMWVGRITHIVALAIFYYFGQLMGLGTAYTVGVVISAVVLYYQHTIIKPNDFSAVNKMYYTRNGYVSIAFFICTVLGLYW